MRKLVAALFSLLLTTSAYGHWEWQCDNSDTLCYRVWICDHPRQMCSYTSSLFEDWSEVDQFKCSCLDCGAVVSCDRYIYCPDDQSCQARDHPEVAPCN